MKPVDWKLFQVIVDGGEPALRAATRALFKRNVITKIRLDLLERRVTQLTQRRRGVR